MMWRLKRIEGSLTEQRGQILRRKATQRDATRRGGSGGMRKRKRRHIAERRAPPLEASLVAMTTDPTDWLHKRATCTRRNISPSFSSVWPRGPRHPPPTRHPISTNITQPHNLDNAQPSREKRGRVKLTPHIRDVYVNKGPKCLVPRSANTPIIWISESLWDSVKIHRISESLTDLNLV